MDKSCKISGGSDILHRMVVVGGTVGVAMLSFRVTRLFLSGLVVGLKSYRRGGDRGSAK